MQALGRQAMDWVVRHLATLADQPVGHTGTRAELEALLRCPPPESGRDFAAVLREFEEKVASHAFRTNHPRFLAFIPSAPSFLSVLGELLCAGTNFFGSVWLEAAAPSQVELLVLDWFKELLGCPASTRGVLTAGGSEANLTALVTAREPLSFEERARAVLYVTEQRHWSVDRAARVMGLRPDQLRPVSADERFRLRPDALGELVRRDRAEGRRPWALVANAGATNTGAVDALALLGDFCRREQLWFHVDAAYGWVAVLTPEGKALLEGIGAADSLTLDPHKWFGQTFESGCVLVRDGRLLGRTFAMQPEYMQDVEPAEDQINFADHGIALTRRFRALKLWLSVQVLGLSWFRRLVEHCCLLAEYGQRLLEEAGCFEILSPRELSIVGFRYVSPVADAPGSPASQASPERQRREKLDERLNALNLALVEALRATGRAFLSSTRLGGRVALRFCFVNWRTTAGDVEEVVGLLRELGERRGLSPPG